MLKCVKYIAYFIKIKCIQNRYFISGVSTNLPCLMQKLPQQSNFDLII